MGYTTQFDGSLKFNREMTEPELAFIKSMFWLEGDYSAPWIHPHGKPHYIQLELTKDNDGIQWDGSEKFYDAVEAVNFIIDNAKRQITDFALSGQLLAQGEEVGDIWRLKIDGDGFAKRVNVKVIEE